MAFHEFQEFAMSKDRSEYDSGSQADSAQKGSTGRSYVKPVLVRYGSLQHLTSGSPGSAAEGASGMPMPMS